MRYIPKLLRVPVLIGLASAAAQFAPAAALALHRGWVTLMVWAKATPSVGMITLWTVFCRS